MTTIDLDRSSLAGHDDTDARAYAAYLAAHLDREVPAEAPHRVRLGAGGTPPEGYRDEMQDAWDAWCRLSQAEHDVWRQI